MKETPLMSSYVKKTGVKNLNALVLLPDGVTLRISLKEWVAAANACNQETLSSPPVFKI